MELFGVTPPTTLLRRARLPSYSVRFLHRVFNCIAVVQNDYSTKPVCRSRLMPDPKEWPSGTTTKGTTVVSARAGQGLPHGRGAGGFHWAEGIAKLTRSRCQRHGGPPSRITADLKRRAGGRQRQLFLKLHFQTSTRSTSVVMQNALGAHA